MFVGRDKCFHLTFLPNNAQDFGFRGELFVKADSSWQVRRCVMTIPKQGGVNFVEGMTIAQEFAMLPDSTLVLASEDLFTELVAVSFLQSFAVVRSTSLTDYAFDELPPQLFRGRKREVVDVNANMRSDEFWNQYRPMALTKAEGSMSEFLRGLEGGQSLHRELRRDVYRQEPPLEGGHRPREHHRHP